MTDFLTRLVGRSLGAGALPRVQPVVASRFAPDPAPLDLGPSGLEAAETVDAGFATPAEGLALEGPESPARPLPAPRSPSLAAQASALQAPDGEAPAPQSPAAPARAALSPAAQAGPGRLPVLPSSLPQPMMAPPTPAPAPYRALAGPGAPEPLLGADAAAPPPSAHQPTGPPSQPIPARGDSPRPAAIVSEGTIGADMSVRAEEEDDSVTAHVRAQPRPPTRARPTPAPTPQIPVSAPPFVATARPRQPAAPLASQEGEQALPSFEIGNATAATPVLASASALGTASVATPSPGLERASALEGAPLLESAPSPLLAAPAPRLAALPAELDSPRQGAPPQVRVTIGRIEVRGTPAPPAPEPAPLPGPDPLFTLEQYLKQREGAGR